MKKEQYNCFKLNDIADVLISGVDKNYKDNEIVVRLCNYTDVYYSWAITNLKANNFMLATATQSEIDKFSLKKRYGCFNKG